jgi:hypothetical protein
MCKWNVGRLECWNVGMLECWNDGRMEEWKNDAIRPPIAIGATMEEGKYGMLRC